MKYINIILFFFCVSLTAPLTAQVRPFDTAYGAGAYTTGARNDGTVTPTIVHVTNLNDSGSGSLREAMMMTIPRYIVFDVGGIINLTSDQIRTGASQSNMTINGFSAPFPGITIVGYAVKTYYTDNIIIRGIRFRNGYRSEESPHNKTCLQIQYAENVIIDRCSAAYGREKGISFVNNTTNISGYAGQGTIQNCLIGNSLEGYMVGNSRPNPEFFGDVSCLRNVTSNTYHRHPKIGAVNHVDVINNITHAWGWRAIRWSAFSVTKFNLINNRWINGININFSSDTGSTDGIHGMDASAGVNASIYESGNVITPNTPLNYTTEPWNAWFPFPDGYDDPSEEPIDSSWWKSSQLTGISGLSLPTILNASELNAELLPKVGACEYIDNNGNVQFYRDDLDTDLVSYVNGTSSSRVNTSTYQSLAEALTAPSTSRPASFSTLNDGIEDSWRTANMPNGALATDINPATSRMYIEDFYNQIDGTPENIPQITRTDTNPTTYVVGDTYLGISGTWTDVEDGTGTANFSGGIVDINTAGTYPQYLNYTDTDGNLGQLLVNIIYTEAPISATSATVTPASVSIGINEATQLTAVVNGSGGNAADQTGTWSSDDTGIATVNSNGLVTAVAQGTVTITFTSTDGSFTDTSAITVTSATVTPAAAILDSVVLTDGDYVLTFHTTAGTEVPSGNYNTYITSAETNNVRQNQDDHYTHSGFTRTITDLNTSISQTFEVDARYLQYDPYQFYMSNAITVQPVAGIPTNLEVSDLTKTSFTVTWDDVSADSYDVYINDVFTSNVTNGTTYNASGLTPSSTYTFLIVSKNISNEVIASSEELNIITKSLINYGKGKSNKQNRKLLMH